jgi:transposase
MSSSASSRTSGKDILPGGRGHLRSGVRATGGKLTPSSPRTSRVRTFSQTSLVPAPHPPEFRRRAVQLARERAKPIAEIARDLQISESFLRNWLAQADVDENGSATELTSKEKKELVELRRDKRRLEMEVEILKRAAEDSMRPSIR